jgi:hypothetical protein
MPGVRPLGSGDESGRCGAESHEGRRLRLACGAWLSSAGESAARAWRALRAPRRVRLESRPNKRMHATADTTAVIFLQSGGAARDARRYGSASRSCKDVGRLRAVESYEG